MQVQMFFAMFAYPSGTRCTPSLAMTYCKLTICVAVFAVFVSVVMYE